MISIIPIYNENYNCIENILASLAAFWKCDCYMISSEVWGFSYKTIECSSNKSVLIGNKLNSNSGDYFKLFGQYHNVEINIYDLNLYNITDLKNIITSEIDINNPVILMINLFWCPWTKFYKIFEAIHYCMIIGVNEENQLLYCIDPFYTLEVIELPMSDFEQGSMSCITLHKLNKKDNNIEWCSVIKNAALHYLGDVNIQSTYLEMCNFAQDVRDKYNAAEEYFQMGDKKFSFISNEINHIRLARLSFSDFLKNFATKYKVNSLYEYSKRMLELGKSWYNINIMFIKTSYMGEKDLLIKRISKTILDLAEKEKNVAMGLLRLSEGDTVELENLEIEKNRYKYRAGKKNDLFCLCSECQQDVMIIEKKLIDIWQEVLERKAVGVNENFFELGGNSLTLVMMHNKIDELYPDKIDVTDIFAYRTVSKLAEYIKNTDEKNKTINSLSTLMELPKDFFEDVIEEKIHIFSSNIELEASKKIKKISNKYNVKVSSIFLAIYIYLIYDIAKKQNVIVHFSVSGKFLQLIDVNLEKMEDISELIKKVDDMMELGRTMVHSIVNQIEPSNRALMVFCENNSIYEIPYVKNKLVLTVSESYKGYNLKVKFANLNKKRVKDMFYHYIRIIKYITQNDSFMKGGFT